MHFFYATYKTLQVFVIKFCKSLFFKKMKLKIYFRIFIKVSVQLKIFSMHVIHFFLQSETELWLQFIHFTNIFIVTSRNFHLGQFTIIMLKYGFTKNFKTNFHNFIEVLTKKCFQLSKERSTSILFAKKKYQQKLPIALYCALKVFLGRIVCE